LLAPNLDSKLIKEKEQVDRFIFSPDLKITINNKETQFNLLATADADNKIKLWDMLGRQIAEFESDRGEVIDLKFSLDGKYLIAIEESNQEIFVQYWDLSGELNLDTLIEKGCKFLDPGFLEEASDREKFTKELCIQN
jgi:WD40 repeat protein